MANPVKGGTNIVNKVAAGANIAKGIAGIAATVAALNIKKPESSKQPDKNLMFPNDLVDETADRNHYITFQFQSYQRRSIFDQVFLKATDGIRLPIPQNLVDTQSVKYGEEGAGSAVGAGMEGAAGGGGIGGMAKNAVGIAEGVGLDIASKAASGANIPFKQVLQMNGVAQNPFLTVLFESPAFKNHTFSWKLAPNNIQESNTLRDIITIFRKRMLPAMAPSMGGTLLTYPDMVIISLSPSDEYLYKFKPCVIESMSINYAPATSPSFFKGTNAPTEVQLSLNLKEIEYWLQEDVVDASLRSQGKGYNPIK
jgi:hypothetical protein